MNCICGNRARCKEGRANPYNMYRLYVCDKCGNKFATVESKMDYEECRKMIRKIFYVRYIKKPKEKKRRRRRE